MHDRELSPTLKQFNKENKKIYLPIRRDSDFASIFHSNCILFHLSLCVYHFGFASFHPLKLITDLTRFNSFWVLFTFTSESGAAWQVQLRAGIGNSSRFRTTGPLLPSTSFLRFFSAETPRCYLLRNKNRLLFFSICNISFILCHLRLNYLN